MGDGDKFCDHCGGLAANMISGKKPPSLGKIILFLIIGFVAIILFLAWLGGDYQAEEAIVDDRSEVCDLLCRLNPYIEPIGYFDESYLLDNDTTTEELLANVKYYDIEETESFFDESKNQFPNQKNIFSSVVKIVCEDSRDKSVVHFGSGVNNDASGFVLTNKHVVSDSDIDDCIVGFPDPETGLIIEAYWSTVILDEEDETGYDLAYLSIENPVIGESNGVYGSYDRVLNSSFPFFEQSSERCLETLPQLGDRLFIVGYPFLSGGALTITDGLVSSLYSRDYFIITSAKINSGNSGGLAVDGLGCYVGVPTASYQEEGEEYLGEIIDAQFVYEFMKAIQDDLEDYIEGI